MYIFLGMGCPCSKNKQPRVKCLTSPQLKGNSETTQKPKQKWPKSPPPRPPMAKAHYIHILILAHNVDRYASAIN